MTFIFVSEKVRSGQVLILMAKFCHVCSLSLLLFFCSSQKLVYFLLNKPQPDRLFHNINKCLEIRQPMNFYVVQKLKTYGFGNSKGNE